MVRSSLILFVLLFAAGCVNQLKDPENTPSYPSYIGEISFDSTLDMEDFERCDPDTLVQSRLGVAYVGGNHKLEEECRERLGNLIANFEYEGYIVARFLINCHKKTGWIRLQTLNLSFKEQDCPPQLQKRVKECILSLEKWTFTREENFGRDHSKYLNFKFSSGELQSIIH